MEKPGRNSPCPCGSGKKYKRCCGAKASIVPASDLRRGSFRYEPGSYGGPDAFVPSILCYEEVEPGTWKEHFCLVKPDSILETEDAAASMATLDLDRAFSAGLNTGSAREFAIALRDYGYKKLDDFQVVAQPPLEPAGGQDEVFEEVSFLSIESGTDLIVSYAITTDEPGDVISLTLLRTPKYEVFLDESEIGVHVSYEKDEEEPDAVETLLSAEIESRTVTLTTYRRRFVLDIAYVGEEDIDQMKRVLKKMNFDGRFRLRIR